ncbi:hypothetical protein ACROYT_G002007 [Oculina patagonica]
MPSRSLSIPYQEQPSSCTLSKFMTVSIQDVKKSIMSAPSKSCSLDPLPTSLPKKGIDVLLPCIATIINRSLELGEFPATLKHGLVTPLLKKSDLDHEILKNYRPISNLPFLGKVIESIVAMQVKHHLVINNLYTKTQSAYRAYHSTETALLRVSNDINLALDNHDDVVLVLLNLSSAFDTIDHSVLMDRLYTRFGLRAAVNIAGSEIKTSVNARDLGVTLDQCFTMSTHVSNLCKSASFALKRIGNIRQYLDQPSTEKLVHAFVPSKLDRTTVTVSCMVSLIKKSRKFNVFRTRPPDW